MPTPRFKFRAIALMLAILPMSLSACTPEKAQALLTAAKTFQAQADAALVAVQDLFIEANQPLPQTREENIENFIKGVRATVKGGKSVTEQEVVNRLGKGYQRRIKAIINAEFSELRQYYAIFADSLTSLPQGSFFAAEGVACTVDIAVRLTGSLANYAKNLKDSPTLPKQKIGQLRGQLVNELKKAAPEDAKVVSLTRRLDEVIQNGLAANEEAIRLILVAAEQGRQVSELAKKYDDISIADILAGVQKSLTIAGSVRGLDTESMVNRLGNLRADMEKDNKVWKRILALPVHEPSDNCKLKGAKT